MTDNIITINGVPIHVDASVVAAILLGQKQEQVKETPLFHDYAMNWYTRYKEPKLRPKTRVVYAYLMGKHIFPFFETMRLSDITSETIQTFYDNCSALCHSTVRQMRVILHQIFASAIEDKWIRENPTESCRHILPSRASERKALTREEIQDIIGHLPRLKPQDAMLMYLLIYTGERRGEVLGLRWEDVDFENDLISVQRAVTFVKGKPVVGEPKSRAGYREIPILPELKQCLENNRKMAGYIIGDGEQPITETSFKRRYERIGKQIDLHGATPHVFRHTFLTMASDKIDTKTLQMIAGHSSYSITFNRYVHGRVEKIRGAGSKMERMFA